MLKHCHLFIGYVLLALGLSQASYLPDYEYIQGVGWLRLHIVPATWADAQLRCHLEDATLTAPTTSDITAVMKKTMIAHKLAESSVFTDIYASHPKGDFTSINGLPMSSITLQWADGEPNNLRNEEDCLVMTGAGELADVSCSSVHPFFCLKRNTTSNCDQCNTAHNENECNCTIEANQCNTTQETKQCDTTAEGYTLEPRTGSCYKFYPITVPWHRAAIKCFSERAHLAVINSQTESEVLKELFEHNLPSYANNHKYIHLGFLDWNEGGQWLTIFGETLYAAGYHQWARGEPNNLNNSNEYCGSMTRNGELNDFPCTSSDLLSYICEINPKL